MFPIHPTLAPTILVRRGEVKDAPGIARVQVESWRAQRKGILSAQALAQPAYLQRVATWQATLSSPVTDRLTIVATTGKGTIVGFACASLDCAAEVLQGEIRAMHVAPSYRHQGVGSQLLGQLAIEFCERGLSRLLVWVLAACPSRHFYEAHGARYLWQRDSEIAGHRSVELAYGWRSLVGLAAR